jgi:hypothetical protein
MCDNENILKPCIFEKRYNILRNKEELFYKREAREIKMIIEESIRQIKNKQVKSMLESAAINCDTILNS